MDSTINNPEETLTTDNIKDAYDCLVEDDFFATMGGWEVPRRRISALFGREVGERYKRWMDSL